MGKGGREIVMKQFPENIKFKYDWRKYQQKVLNQLDEKLIDNHLHIVAPPGSGKTVLGLEVALRINKPTLVFAPTIAIRNQWIQRFTELFLQTSSPPDWISSNIRNPKFLTVVTYQSLHAVLANDIEKTSYLDEEIDLEEEIVKESKIDTSKFDQIIQLYKKHKIGTIVIDEAHHLKNSWWKSLNLFKNEIQATFVGLTATPPYDVSYQEWQRYIELNGSIDLEITIPELIEEGDLCPHQDLVHCSQPTSTEIQKIYDYRDNVKALYEDLLSDKYFIEYIENHKFITSPNQYIDFIYNNVEYYSSLLIFLNEIGKPISQAQLELLDAKQIELPIMTYQWMEILLANLLFKDPDLLNVNEEYFNKLLNKLKHSGVVEKQLVSFTYNPKLNSYLSNSLNKMNSIKEIVKQEYENLQSDLRLVILTDYIRKEYLIQQENSMKLGVIPIFKELLKENISKNIAVLTGSIIIISEKLYAQITERLCFIHKEECNFQHIDGMEGFIQLQLNDKIRHLSVQVVTDLFQEGKINILIGTKSLLGEGWDAPSINVLILASFVGSYVSSNQMRGRAIRSLLNNPDKTANVWHLLSIDPSSKDGGEDFNTLKRRFKTFVGLSFEEGSIENDIYKFNFPKVWDETSISDYNALSIERSGKRHLLKEKWLNAVAKGKIVLEEIKIPYKKNEDYTLTKKVYYHKTIKNLLISLGSALMLFSYDLVIGLLKNLLAYKSIKQMMIFLMITFGFGVLHYGRLTYKTLKIYIKYRDIAKDIHQIGYVILYTLYKMKFIQTPLNELVIHTEIDNDGVVYTHLKGGTTHERSLFIKTIQEFLEPLKNPRYMIIRKSKFLNYVKQLDYHPIPELIGKNKKNVIYFQEMWNKFVGKYELIFTRDIIGRKILIKARIQSLANAFDENTSVVSKWR